jgi:putative FmdB family regulatory protein
MPGAQPLDWLVRLLGQESQAVPIYEFYCVDCHTVFNFLSRTVNTTKRPACPRCGRPELERRVSRFAVSRRRAERDEPGRPDDLPPGFDEEKMERAMEALAEGGRGRHPQTKPQQEPQIRKNID